MEDNPEVALEIENKVRIAILDLPEEEEKKVFVKEKAKAQLLRLTIKQKSSNKFNFV